MFGGGSAADIKFFTEEEKITLNHFFSRIVYNEQGLDFLSFGKPTSIPEGYNMSKNRGSTIHWSNIRPELFFLQPFKADGEGKSAPGAGGYNFGIYNFSGRFNPDNTPEVELRTYTSVEFPKLASSKDGVNTGKGQYEKQLQRVVSNLSTKSADSFPCEEEGKHLFKILREVYLAQLAFLLYIKSRGQKGAFDGLVASGNAFDSTCPAFVAKNTDPKKAKGSNEEANLLLLRCSAHSKKDEFKSALDKSPIPYEALKCGFLYTPYVCWNRIYVGAKSSIQVHINSALVWGKTTAREDAATAHEVTEEERQAFAASFGDLSIQSPLTSLPTTKIPVVTSLPLGGQMLPLGSLTVPSLGSSSSSFVPPVNESPAFTFDSLTG